MHLLNPFESEGNWYKANLHTHTTNSDGDQDPEARAAQYREHGYDILAITDHRLVTAIEGMSTPQFLVIRSLEAHPESPGDSGLYHFVCLNVPPAFEYDPETEANELVRQVRESGGETIFAHPYWCGHDVEDIMAVGDLIGVEVYNSTCTKIGKGDSSVIWDYLLDAGYVLPAVAVDDVHRGRDIFMGWTMVRAPELTVDAVMDALRAGCYYASCGPEILDFRSDDGVASIRCSPVSEIHFKCNRSCGRAHYADDGEPLTGARYEVPASARYVRAEVVDDRGRRAWTNPVVLGS